MRRARVRRERASWTANHLLSEDAPGHRWYRFVLSFPPQLVREYVERFGLREGQTVLDPFCGTGTTLVECKKLGLGCVGIEAHPMAHFASEVKLDWSPDADGLLRHARAVARAAMAELARQGIEDDPIFAEGQVEPAHVRRLPPESERLLLEDSISPLPLHKTLVRIESLDTHGEARYVRHERLALAKSLVLYSSNLHFGPEVGLGEVKEDAPVIGPWLNTVQQMAADLELLPRAHGSRAVVHLADARSPGSVLEPHSIDAVITSPPYPNEKDYTRTTRLESVLLGFIRDRAELRELKRALVRSNTRGVYKEDDDDRWVAEHRDIQRISEAIEHRRVELGKSSGFERLYGRVTKLYFGGIRRHLAELRSVLRPGARLAYVVGDQASYLRVMIRTGQILADVAQALGYQVERDRPFPHALRNGLPGTATGGGGGIEMARVRALDPILFASR